MATLAQLKPCRIICSASAHKYSMVLSWQAEAGKGGQLPASICGTLPTSLRCKRNSAAAKTAPAQPCGKWGPSIKPAALRFLPRPPPDKTAHFQLQDRQQCNNRARQLATCPRGACRASVVPVASCQVAGGKSPHCVFLFSISASIAAASMARMLHGACAAFPVDAACCARLQ